MILNVFNEQGTFHSCSDDPVEVASLLRELGVYFDYDYTGVDQVDNAFTEIVRDCGQKPSVDYFESEAVTDEDRAKYVREHTHNDIEARLFLEGEGTFFLHVDKLIYAVRCRPYTLIALPKQIKHWFSYEGRIKVQRFFTQECGWVATYTGDDIAMTVK